MGPAIGNGPPRSVPLRSVSGGVWGIGEPVTNRHARNNLIQHRRLVSHAEAATVHAVAFAGSSAGSTAASSGISAEAGSSVSEATAGASSCLIGAPGMGPGGRRRRDPTGSF